MEGVGGVRDGGCGMGQGWRVWEGTGMEGVGGDRDGGCGRGQGWRVWEGSGMEGVGGVRDGGCGMGQGWRVWEGTGMEGIKHYIIHYVCVLFATIHNNYYAAAAVTRIIHIANYNWKIDPARYS